MAEVKVKGSLYLSRLKYLDSQVSREQRERILEQLTPECRGFLSGTILPSNWCPIAYLDELMIAMDAVLGNGDLVLIAEFGRYSAEQAVRGLYKAFLRLRRPEFVVQRLPLLWSQLIDHGSIAPKRITEDDSKYVNYELHLEQCEALFSKSFVLALLGWTGALLGIAGAKNLKLKVGQFPRPADFNCGYISATWEK